MFSLKTNSNQSSEPSDLVTTVVPTTDQRTANDGLERTHINLWWLKNGSLLAYFISAAIGIIVMTTLRFIFQPYRPEVLNEFLKGGRSYTLAPILLAMIIIVIVLYERPIRRLFNWRFKGRMIPMDLLTMARRRTLNEPYFVALLSIICGLVGAVVVAVAHYRIGLPNPITRMGAPDALLLSIITATISFLALEFFLHRWLALPLFPEGGLQHISGVWKISLRIRLISLFVAINLIPLAASLLTAYRTADSLEVLLVSLFATIPIYVAAGFILTILMAGNLSGSLKNLTTVLRGVSQGNLSSRVNVTSNDEIGYAGDVVNAMITGLKERDFIKETFGKYVSEEIRDEVLSGRTPLDGERKDVTILFSDLRNFTSMTESNDPKLVVKIMNLYFKEMAEAIQDQAGLVLQFIGDEIYAVFGAPVFMPDHPTRAFRAGLEMNRRLIKINGIFVDEGWPRLIHGIGIHTGKAIAANIGSPNRLSYLLVGDTVNLASRLQSLTKEVAAEMIISAATYSRLTETERATAELSKLPPTTVKGKKQPVEIFAVTCLNLTKSYDLKHRIT